MRNICLVLLLAAVALALLSCSGEDAAEDDNGAREAAETKQTAALAAPTTTERTARCAAESFRVSFVQADRVTVETGEGVLAFASYTDRTVDASCPDKPLAAQYADGELGEASTRTSNSHAPHLARSRFTSIRFATEAKPAPPRGAASRFPTSPRANPALSSGLF